MQSGNLDIILIGTNPNVALALQSKAQDEILVKMPLRRLCGIEALLKDGVQSWSFHVRTFVHIAGHIVIVGDIWAVGIAYADIDPAKFLHAWPLGHWRQEGPGAEELLTITEKAILAHYRHLLNCSKRQPDRAGELLPSEILHLEPIAFHTGPPRCWMVLHAESLSPKKGAVKENR
jgi:hypothetical protein